MSRSKSFKANQDIFFRDHFIERIDELTATCLNNDTSQASASELINLVGSHPYPRIAQLAALHGFVEDGGELYDQESFDSWERASNIAKLNDWASGERGDIPRDILRAAIAALRYEIVAAYEQVAAVRDLDVARLPDEVVVIDRTAPGYSELIASLEALRIEIAKRSNNFGDQEAERLSAEVSAGQALVSSGTARIKSIFEVLVKLLKWMSEKFSGAIVGGIAALALQKLLQVLPQIAKFLE